ncbi:hypothetical protein BDV93DRAFT_547915 [Ceratobasidium sp. AG-I]|nr:hypothetical protein BDV93DRAFT_547915 [Ceratobasidium sp. AG-I]
MRLPSRLTASALVLLPSVARCALVDLTKANRREPLPDLPDWSGAGFEGGNPLPDDSKVAFTLSAAQLASQYGVVPNDGQDDTVGLQNAINAMSSQSVPAGSYRLIQLPAGTINLSYMIYVDTSYLIIRGTGNNPNAGGTKIVFRPDADTKYDTLVNDRWDLDNMEYNWDFLDDAGKRVFGTASGGWLWPGRSIFRIGSSQVASKYTRQHAEAPRNRKELFKGSVNYHWRSDEGKVKGWMVSQDKDKAGVSGTSLVHVNVTNTTWVTSADLSTTDLWIASPTKRNDFLSWGVETDAWFVNSYIFQDWFTITQRGNDAGGNFYKLDHPLRFDVYRSSTGDGSSPMEDTETFAKAMPIAHVVHHVGIENLYMTHEIDGLTPESAQRNYGNLAPAQAQHGIVFRFARDSWVRNIQTFMTGSHPIATEAAKNIQIQDNYFDGSWNKGKGGNGYLRGSRVWDSLYYNNTMRNLRHITMQWCAMGNVVVLNNITYDMNLHGGWEGFNLFELNYVSVPFSHRSGSCSSCGGESGDQEPGTWFPIWWGAGEKASKWSGASGPRNVFYRNYMIKQQVDAGEYIEYRPYFARDGSLSPTIWQMGWDSQSPAGIRYSHLSLENRAPIKDWQSHEQVDWSESPGYGANSGLNDPHTSIFFKDVSAAAGSVATFSGIAGNTYCRGDVLPRVAGFYFASASRRTCNPFPPSSIDYDSYTHIMFAYGVLARDGGITIAAADQQLLRDVAALKSKDSSLKVFLAIGGWGLGADATNMVAIASSAAARTKVGTTGATICQTYGLDGIDLEWASGISATQWKNIVQGAAPGLKASNFNLSISTPHSFWTSSGVNTVAADIAKSVDFMSLISHDLPGTTLEYANSLSKMTASVASIHKLGFPRGQIMMGVPFYGRSRRLSATTCSDDGCGIATGLGSTSECIGTSNLGQGTFPYFSIDSRVNHGSLDTDSVGSAKTITNSAGRFVTDSGYVFDYETPASVVEKARAATMLCAAGLSVYSLDQDNRDFELTNAIWGGGALLPSAAEIVSTITGEPLDSNGLVTSDFWDGAAAQILENYPNLSMVLNYQVMILLALKALDAVASSLFEYLKFSALTEDSFELYKKWETKALNWALANETGKGNDFWQCSYSQSNFAHETCPGGHNTRGADVSDVYWRLTDAAGFSTYLTNSMGIDTSELLIGNIYVGRNPSTCITIPLRRELSDNSTSANTTLDIRFDDAVPETNKTIIANSYLFEDDGTGRIRRIPVANSTALATRHHVASMAPYNPEDNSKGFSPYDPDKQCRTQWHDVLVIDADKFFPNVKDGIQAYLDQYEDFKLTALQVTSSPLETIESLGPILHMALTTLVSGNDTLYSTMGYIEQVKYDKALQENYDALEEQARQAAIQLIVDLVLTLLSFIPFGGLVSAAARAARALLPVFRSARATRSIARGLEKALDGAMDAKNIRAVDELLSDTAVAGRGRIGRALNKIQEACFQCEGADYVGDVLDLASMALPIFAPSSATRRSYSEIIPLEPESNITEIDEHPRAVERSNHQLEARGPNDVGSNRCIWHESFAADGLKSKTYQAGCHANSANYPMEWLDETDGYKLKTITFAKCRPLPSNGDPTEVDPAWKKDGTARKGVKDMPGDPGRCQCDHMLEADEVVGAFKRNFNSYTQKLSKAKKDALATTLCSQPEYGDFFDKLKAKLNSNDNMRPLFKQPNIYKSSFIRPDMLTDSAKSWPTWQKASADDKSTKGLYMGIMDRFMTSIKGTREQVAQGMDNEIKALSFSNTAANNALTGMNLGARDVDIGNNQKQSMGFLEASNFDDTEKYKHKLVMAKYRDAPTVPSGLDASDTSPVQPDKKKRAASDSGEPPCRPKRARVQTKKFGS